MPRSVRAAPTARRLLSTLVATLALTASLGAADAGAAPPAATPASAPTPAPAPAPPQSAPAPAPAQSTAAPAPAPAGTVISQDPSLYAFELDTVNFNSTVVFTQGNLQSVRARERGTIAFQLRNHSAQPFLAIQNVRIDSALTDGGEQLADASLAAANAYAVRGAFRAMHTANQHELSASGIIRVPRRQADFLTVSGSVQVLFEGSSIPPIDLKPASAWLNKKQDIPGCANGFTLISLAPLRYRLDESVFSSGLLKDLQFLDAAGKPLPIFAMQSNNEHDVVLITGSQPLPADATISLVVCGDPHHITLPFSFTRIPLHPSEAPPATPAKAPAPPGATAPAKP